MIAVIADPHVGNFKAHGGATVDGLNDRGRMSLETFRQAIRTACELGVDVFCIAGDLFQSRRPEPAVISGVLKVLVEDARNLPVLIIPGNHDMMDSTAATGNTACQPLYREATVVNAPEWIPAGETGSIFAVPFYGQESMSAYLKKLLEAQADAEVEGQRILLTHVGVYDDKSPPWCKGAKDSIHKDALFAAMEKGGFSTAFVGNYHNGKSWHEGDGTGTDRFIVQCGTLCPHSHSDAGFFPGVGTLWTFDGLMKPQPQPQPHEIAGPRFFDTAEGRTLALVSPSGVDGVTNMIDLAVEPLSAVQDRVLAADLPQAKDAPHAITGYVDKMQLGDEVDRKAVQTAAIDVWSRA